MKDRFELASHLTYIVGCVATDLTGEAKFELSQLIPAVEISTIDDKEQVLAKLIEARDLFKSGDYRRAAISTVSANSLLHNGLHWPED